MQARASLPRNYTAPLLLVLLRVGKAGHLVNCSHHLPHNNEFKGVCFVCDTAPLTHNQSFVQSLPGEDSVFTVLSLYIHTILYYKNSFFMAFTSFATEHLFFLFWCSGFVFLSVVRTSGRCCECFEAKSWWLSV